MNLVFSTFLPRVGRSLAALALVGFGISGLANAGTISFEAPTVDITAGQAAAGVTGFADVTATDSSSDSVYIDGEDLYLNPGTTGVSIIAGDFNTTAPYIFLGNSSDQLNSSGVFVDTYDNGNNFDPGSQNESEVQVSDLSNNGNATTLTSVPLGIVRIEYSIPAGTPAGTYTLNLVPSNEGGTGTYTDTVSASDANTNNYLVPTIIDGAIVVLPEPGSVVLMVLGAVGLVGIGFRRARRA